MQETSYRQLVERLAQCEELAKSANDTSVREKAAELAQGYRDLIASADQLARHRSWQRMREATRVDQPGVVVRPVGSGVKAASQNLVRGPT